MKILSIVIRIDEAPILSKEEKENVENFVNCNSNWWGSHAILRKKKENVEISIRLGIVILFASMLIFEKSKDLKIFKFELKLRRVAEDETKNTGQTEGASFSKRQAQSEADGQQAEPLENDTWVQEE